MWTAVGICAGAILDIHTHGNSVDSGVNDAGVCTQSLLGLDSSSVALFGYSWGSISQNRGQISLRMCDGARRFVSADIFWVFNATLGSM